MTARHVCLLFRRFTQWGADVTQPYVAALEARGIPHMLVGGKSFHLREEVESLRTALTAIEWPDDELAVYGDPARAALRGGRRGAARVPRPRSGACTRSVSREGRAGGRRIWRRSPTRSASSASCTAGATTVPSRTPSPRSSTATRAHAAFILRPSGERALANVLRIAELARSWEASGGISFRGFVEQLAEEGEGDAPEAPVVEEGSEGVRIMTVHRAKGLEFPVVILADIARQHGGGQSRPPHRRRARTLRGAARRLVAVGPPRPRGGRAGARPRRGRARRVRGGDPRARPARGARGRRRSRSRTAGRPRGESWIEPVQRAVYPRGGAAPRARARARVPAPRRGQRARAARSRDAGPRQRAARPPRARRAGRHADYPVVWWDPRALTLDVQPVFGIRRQDLIEDPGPDVTGGRPAKLPGVAARAARRRCELGARPSLVVQTVTEWAERGAVDGGAPEPEVTVVDAASGLTRPAGPRFGTLVHAILATVALDAGRDAVAEVAALQGRLLGAPPEETAAATAVVEAALAHPLLLRAREAWRRGRCRRECPDHRGRRPTARSSRACSTWPSRRTTAGRWSTSRPRPSCLGPLARHRRQVGAYASVVSRVTGRPAMPVLLRL